MSEELNLKQIIEILLPRWVFILVASLVVGAIFCVYTVFFVEPVYVAQGSLYINASAESQENKDAQLTDLMISQELARTYGEILSSNTFFKTVAKQSRTDYTYTQLQRLTSIEVVENTGLLQINAMNTDPKVASRIVNTILKYAPKEIERVVVGGSATVIDLAETPKAPAAPSVPKNTIIGVLVGFVFSILFIFLQNMFDKSIKSADELREAFGFPVLGTIPVIDPRRDEERSKSGYRSTGSKSK